MGRGGSSQVRYNYYQVRIRILPYTHGRSNANIGDVDPRYEQVMDIWLYTINYGTSRQVLEGAGHAMTTLLHLASYWSNRWSNLVPRGSKMREPENEVAVGMVLISLHQLYWVVHTLAGGTDIDVDKAARIDNGRVALNMLKNIWRSKEIRTQTKQYQCKISFPLWICQVEVDKKGTPEDPDFHIVAWEASLTFAVLKKFAMTSSGSKGNNNNR